MVNGKISVAHGQLTHLDETKFVADANQLQKLFVSKADPVK
ncbi:hypothetical protein [Agrilactobacillus composti]|nr:hypothetical protein [Agrilactobacillus composti]